MRPEIEQLLKNFRFLDPTWTGNAYVKCWGDSVDIELVPGDSDQFTQAQLTTLRSLLGYAEDLRPNFSERVYQYYQEDVFECSDYFDNDGNDITDDCAPRIQHPNELWDLITLMSIRIDAFNINSQDVEFQMLFDCRWDEEHGLGVKYRNWCIAYIGGWSF